MKLSHFKFAVIFPALVLSSCGYGLKQTYKGNAYNSTVFAENYYNVWNDNIKPGSKKILYSKDELALTAADDKVFTSFYSAEFKECEMSWDTYLYETDLEKNRLGQEGTLYGPDVKLSRYDSSFKYGVESKLFDGQLFCNGGFQNSRVQVEPTNQGEDKGFGILFKKECARASYFMMNFKASIVNEDGSYTGIEENQSSTVELHLNFYVKKDQGYICVPVTYTVENVLTNMRENHSNYVCFGFKLDRLFENLASTRIAGFSLQYKKISDSYTSADKQTMHALMLYEVSLPHSTWH